MAFDPSDVIDSSVNGHSSPLSGSGYNGGGRRFVYSEKLSEFLTAKGIAQIYSELFRRDSEDGKYTLWRDPPRWGWNNYPQSIQGEFIELARSLGYWA